MDDGTDSLAARAFDDCAAEGRPIERVHLKVRYAPFDTRTFGRKLPTPTSDRDEFVTAALGLAATVEAEREVRLLGERTPIRGRI